MIPYAGKGNERQSVVFTGRRHVKNALHYDDDTLARSVVAYRAWRANNNTRDVATLLDVSEAEAEKLITIGRCAAKGLSDPYERPKR